MLEENTSPQTPKVATLEEIRARLQARKNTDLSKLPTATHEALGAVYIAHLSTAGYSDVEAVDYPDSAMAEWPVADQVKFREAARLRAYLRHGILTADGKKLPNDLIEELIKGDWGAENKKLLNEIQKKNPPRDVMVMEYQSAIAVSRMSLVLFRLLREAGQLKALRDYLLADEGSEEKKALAEDLQKWENALDPFEALMEASEAAGYFGIGVYERKKSAPQETQEKDEE
jgi:hypothetical protein